MDSEACNILIDYVHDLYTGDYSDEAYFSTVFEKAGKRYYDCNTNLCIKNPIHCGLLHCSYIGMGRFEGT